MQIAVCTHRKRHIFTTCWCLQGGDGVWTCALCGGDGPGVMLSCANRCRVCTECPYLSNPTHVCTDRKDLFAQLKELGAPRESLCLPDCGKGKVEWKKLCKGGLQWADPARTFFGVRESTAILEILDSKGDPLKHPDVVALLSWLRSITCMPTCWTSSGLGGLSYIHMYIYIYVYIYTPLHMYMCIGECTFRYAQLDIYVYIYIYIFIYIINNN